MNVELIPILLDSLKNRLALVKNLSLELNSNLEPPVTKNYSEEIDYEEQLKIMMVMIFPKLIKNTFDRKDFNQLIDRLILIYEISKTKDWRYFDVWHNFFEKFEKMGWNDVRVSSIKGQFLIKYRELLQYHITELEYKV